MSSEFKEITKRLHDIDLKLVDVTCLIKLNDQTTNKRISNHKEQMVEILKDHDDNIKKHDSILYYGKDGIGLIAKVEDHHMYISKKRLSSGSLLDWSFRGFVGFVLTVILYKLNFIPLP